MSTPVERMWERFEARDWEGALAELHDDFTGEWPATGERFGDRSSFVEMNRAYPDIGWHIEVLSVIQEGDRVAAEVRVPNDESVDWCTGFYTLRDGKILRAVEYWTAQEAAPDWRAPFRD